MSNTPRPVVFSGAQPTSDSLHLGNALGTFLRTQISKFIGHKGPVSFCMILAGVPTEESFVFSGACDFARGVARKSAHIT